MSPLFYFPQNRGKNTIFPRHIRFNTEVLSCHWDESGGEWTVKTKSGKDYRANILIPALGAFRKTRVPEFKVRKKEFIFTCCRWSCCVAMVAVVLNICDK